ncbi:TetR family transcriptional regulator [Bacillus sp. J14TS2]|uniref:TetR/AcrR family transcriptional regulator n=1 Tax=Bacillus sp. J14TS2 TaxID=2807188 RepID=UPI001B12161F|nr:TetR/AcrR family transcriptional regulator [Bacillus sp. J14TS2]GIN73774.1 TetR family transcriptional regulator [Bacillus sp. J14TS2]
MNGYEQRTINKQAKIKKAACKLFDEYGIEKTSVSEIAKEAQVSPASIYNYFKTKDGLVMESARDLIEDALREKELLWNSDLPFKELLEKAIKNHNVFLNPSNLNLLEKFIKESEDVNILVKKVFHERYPALLEIFIEKGRRDGYIQREISTETMMIYLKICQSVINNSDVVKANNQVVLSELYDLLIYGLSGKPLKTSDD